MTGIATQLWQPMPPTHNNLHHQSFYTNLYLFIFDSIKFIKRVSITLTKPWLRNPRVLDINATRQKKMISYIENYFSWQHLNVWMQKKSLTMVKSEVDEVLEHFFHCPVSNTAIYFVTTSRQTSSSASTCFIMCQERRLSLRNKSSCCHYKNLMLINSRTASK